MFSFVLPCAIISSVIYVVVLIWIVTEVYDKRSILFVVGGASQMLYSF